jgi:hypothetical protein
MDLTIMRFPAIWHAVNLFLAGRYLPVYTGGIYHNAGNLQTLAPIDLGFWFLSSKLNGH